MGRKFKVWCDSGANSHSCREEIVDLDDLGFDSEDWDAMTDKDRDDAMRDVALDNMEWGFTEIDA